jgi:hypothetical protein
VAIGGEMTSAFRIDQHDDLFAPRTSAEDWAHIIAFRNRPDFLKAALDYIVVSGPFYANNFILNKVVPEAWRFQMIVFLLHLHDMRDPHDPRSGLTLSNFQRLCTQLDLASRGRAFAFLNIMRVGGYLARIPSPRDTRVVHLEPTQLFMETVERWNDGIFRLIDIAAPESRLLQARHAYPALGREMRRRSAERIIAGWKPLGPFPEVLHFAATDGGWMLLAHGVAEAMRNGEGIAPVVINLTHFGTEYSVSRSHLRRLLEGAFESGLLEAPPANGANIRFSSQLVCAFVAWLASYLAGYHQSANEALAER